MNDKDMKRVEAHLKRTFANAQISLRARPKQKDSCELYIGEEFVGVVYQDEDEEGSFLFEMAILAEDWSNPSPDSGRAGAGSRR